MTAMFIAAKIPQGKAAIRRKQKIICKENLATDINWLDSHEHQVSMQRTQYAVWRYAYVLHVYSVQQCIIDDLF